MKKKILLCGLAGAFLISSLGLASVYATNSPVGTNHYVDENKDGVCDNRTVTTQTQKNEDDTLLNCNTGGQGQNYVDEDKDGVCDNQTNKTTVCPQNGMGRKLGNGNETTSQGQNYVDEDYDGVCDNRTVNAGNCSQDGTGMHHRHGGNGHR